MLEQYNLLRQDFLSIAELFIDCNILNQLKTNYTHDIGSKRKLSSVKDLKTFIRLLEKRDIISYKNIEELQCISKLFIGKSEVLESKLLDYENWLKTMPISHLCDMYQSNETSGLSQEENVERNLTTASEPMSSNLSQSSMHSSTVSFNSVTQTLHCYSRQDKTNNLIDKRKSLQQTVLLQLKDRLGRSWRDVARCLHIRECEIDAIQNKYPFDLKEQSYEMLKIYISKFNTEQWTINLIRALEKGRRKDLKELVEDLIWKT